LLMTPAEIRDSALLKLLGDILRPDIDPTATGAMRLRLMHQGFSWQALVDLARGQGVLLPLVFALNARGLLPPIPRSIKYRDSHVTARLGEIYRQHLAQRQSDKRQLEEVLLVLEDAGIVPLILKGARYLVAPVASWCEARSMADFDILLQPSNAERAFTLLKAQGYRQFPSAGFNYGPNFSHHLPALQHPSQLAAVEIHTHALSVAGQRIMSTQHVWARATKAGNGSFFVLPIGWHALHGLLHHQVQDRGHVQRALNIKALWEWTMLAREFTGDDWDAIRAHMREARAADVLDSWLMQSHRLFGREIPSFLEISASARAHADATFRLASRPYWIRRTKYITDQLRASFARETLANKYGIPPSRVSLLHAGKNLMDLLRRHHGNMLQRLTGYRDQLW
jgi:hypothetical protein